MFSPKTTSMLFVLPLSIAAFLTTSANAQNAASVQYQARMAAIQQAQARAQTQQAVSQAEPVRVAQASATRVPRQVVPGQAASSSARSASQTYAPSGTRTAQLLTEGTVIDGGSPIMGETVLSQPVMSGEVIGAPMAGQPIYTDSIQGSIDSGVVYSDDVVVGCDSCGDSGSYFTDDCCGRGGCPDDTPCWQGPLGRALRSGSYFFGATAFQHPAYTSPVGTDLVQDSNFGAYAGFNLGIPLCRLFCGRVSGQFGMRSVQTNFGGSDVTEASRDQLFITAGLYRRVDYGLQAGLVVDVLAEEYFTESDIAQLRGELSWAYPNGGAIGFRFTSSQQDDTSLGIFDGTRFSGLTTTTDEHYRFFLRKVLSTGGWEEIFAGWTGNDHFAVGADFDIPVSQFMALEAGAAYYLNDTEAPNSNLGSSRIEDTFNIYVGFAFRPQGVAYYRSYDRPLLPVADNGTMIIRR
ncbi:DUF6666 family protein [Mariniblastus fucicola]|uniref:Uncharacterized protein n=1 Tax=Mariniblastus fucicola TaxID=980251 RepID=A0A5B9PCY1_9BACT|nr:DUF6666 family protein [Mariniblastus fucicola]QEG22416.1 hypothetical protein MFFC18_22960 [Mariniblastus fucicola]